MGRLIRDEVTKIAVQKKSYVMAFGIFALIVLIMLLYIAPDSRGELVAGGRRLLDTDTLVEYLDGTTFARLLLALVMVFLMPMVICTLAGDSVAGEIQDGGLKLLLSRAQSRSKVLLAKFFAVYMVSLVYLLFFTLTPLLAGIIFFGVSDTQFMMFDSASHSTRVQILDWWGALGRYWLIVGYFVLAIPALISFALFFSVVFNRMTAATVTALSVYFITYVITLLPFTGKLRPWLASALLNDAFVFWLCPIPWTRVMVSLTTLTWYAGGFLLLALMIFRHKDIK